MALPADSEVSLRWIAPPGSASFNVKRSTTNGGPYLTIASNVSGTGYFDSAVVVGTTYFYVVSALNAAGEGPDSAQVSIMPSTVKTIIYSNAFNGGAVNINGTALTYINPSAASYGGRLTATFDVLTNSVPNGYYAYQNGTLGAKLNSVLLPFTPVSGYVYTLSATLTFKVTPPTGGWGGVGFATHLPASNSGLVDPRLGSSSVGGNPWALLNMYANGGGAVLNADGANKGQMTNLMTALNTAYTINIVLDTTAAHWSAALYINGTVVGSYTYTANPSIASIGYTQTTTTAGAFKWGPVTLSITPLELTLASRNGNQMQMNWNYGTLQTATNVAGPYMDMTNVVQPYAIPLTNSQQYFRLKEN